MGWSIHQRFLEHLREGMITPWVYNSSISVAVESFRARIPALGAAGAGIRLLAAGIVLTVLLRARKRIAPGPAQQHFLFWMSTVIGLLLMPIVWEHYLSVLFIPVAYFLAMLPLLGRSEKTLLAAICLSCCTQNLILVMWLFARLKDGGAIVQVAAAVWKSAPLTLFTILLWRHGARLADTYKAAVMWSPAPRAGGFPAALTPAKAIEEL
jgi:hypothetical protein